MAEKRKLLNEIDKCFKKIDEGFEIFDEIMSKMSEANSDNQREKFQDDLKKEIKKLQRLRDQIKGWQNSSDIKDKEKLSHYRKLIEQRMETFKDIERENKTKPHSKQGLSAEEKMDPKEKEKSDAIEWLNNQIRRIQDEIDRTESKLETIATESTVRKRGKKDDSKKVDKEKVEELKKHLETVKSHLRNWEVVMRLITNERLEIKHVLNKLKEPVEMYIESLDPENDIGSDNMDESWLEDVYEELELNSFIPQLQGVHIGSLDEEKPGENGIVNHHTTVSPSDNQTSLAETQASSDDTLKQRHQSESDAKAPLTSTASKSVPATPMKLTRLGRISAESSSLSSPPPITPPPMPSIPYNSVAAGTFNHTNASQPLQQYLPGTATCTAYNPATSNVASISTVSSTLQSIATSVITTQRTSQATSLISSISTSVPLSTMATPATIAAVLAARKVSVDEVRNSPNSEMDFQRAVTSQLGNAPSTPSYNSIAAGTYSTTSASLPPQSSTTLQSTALHGRTSANHLYNSASITSQQLNNGLTTPTTNNDNLNGQETSNLPLQQQPSTINNISGVNSNSTGYNENDLNQSTLMQVLKLNQNPERNTQPQSANIPPWLGASPLGCTQISVEQDAQLSMLNFAANRLPQPNDKPGISLPRAPVPTPNYYPQTFLPNCDTLEYYLKLQPETLFFTFYYMEGTRAQLLAAKALKKLSWRFHTQYSMWFQRHEEPKQITDDFEQGTYVFFDYENWAQRKKEQFIFEYKYLEDKDLDLSWI